VTQIRCLRIQVFASQGLSTFEVLLRWLLKKLRRVIPSHTHTHTHTHKYMYTLSRSEHKFAILLVCLSIENFDAKNLKAIFCPNPMRDKTILWPPKSTNIIFFCRKTASLLWDWWQFQNVLSSSNINKKGKKTSVQYSVYFSKINPWLLTTFVPKRWIT